MKMFRLSCGNDLQLAYTNRYNAKVAEDWFSIYNYNTQNNRRNTISPVEDFEELKDSKKGKRASWQVTPVTNYKQFLYEIEKYLKKTIITKFLLITSDTDLFVLYSPFCIYNSSASDKGILYKTLCIYHYENDGMRDFTKSIFKIDGEVNATEFFSTPANFFSFGVNIRILEVIYASKEIELAGEKLYTFFQKPKKSGGMRQITVPNPKIIPPLQKLNALLQKAYDKRNSEFQIAYKKKKNVKTGALLHKDMKYVYNLDLHDFYPSCKKEIVTRYTDFLFANSYNRYFVEEEFFKVIFINDALFIGSPISGTLANAVISLPVKYLYNLCKKKFNMNVSVYADDITLSSNKFITKQFADQLVKEAFSKYGLVDYFSLNEKKEVGFTGCNRKVTGVSINNNNQVTIPRRYYRDLRVKICHLANGDTNINIQELRGKLAYATMIDDSGKVYNYLMKYLSTVKKYNLCSDEKLEELKNRNV